MLPFALTIGFTFYIVIERQAGRGVAASSDTRQAIVSVSPFQFTTTTPRLPTETIRAPFLPHAHDLHLQGGTYFQPHAVELIKAG